MSALISIAVRAVQAYRRCASATRQRRPLSLLMMLLALATGLALFLVALLPSRTSTSTPLVVQSSVADRANFAAAANGHLEYYDHLPLKMADNPSDQFWLMAAILIVLSVAAPLAARGLLRALRWWRTRSQGSVSLSTQRLITLWVFIGVALLALAISLFSNTPSPVVAFSNFPGYVPNGNYVSANDTSPDICQMCHLYSGGNPLPSDTLGSFSSALKPVTSGQAWLGHGAGSGSPAYNVDTDGDGFTNGEELQDPDGTWVYNADSNYRDTAYASNPNDANRNPPAPSITTTVGLANNQTISNSIAIYVTMRYAALNRVVYRFRNPAGTEVYSFTVNSPALTNYSNRFCLGTSPANTSPCAPWDPGLAPAGVYTVTVTAYDRRIPGGARTGSFTVTNVTITSTTRYVAPTGSDANNSCANSANPCASIQWAADQATSDGEIHVAAGTYTGVTNRVGLNQMVYISKSVTIRGGYTTGNWNISNPGVNLTILNSQGNGRVFYITGNIRVTLAGLRITGGNSTIAGGDSYGGGLWITTAQVTLSNNTIYGNTAGGGVGGGARIVSSPATLDHNIFISNTALAGGALDLVTSNQAVLNGNLFLSNTASSDGGGIQFNQSNATLVNNVFTGNFAGSTGGGGVEIWQSQPTLSHNTFVGNMSTGGAAISLFSGSPVAIATLNNTIVVNHSTDTAVVALSGTTANFDGVLWFGNASNTGGAGTINIANAYTGDPAFLPDGYHITVNSAALDRGVATGVNTDIDGDARPQIAGPDLGADEFVPIALNSVVVNGPTLGFTNIAYQFTAIVTPTNPTFPITYTWQAVDQPIIVNVTTNLANTVSYTWTTEGSKPITVTATNAAGAVSGSYQWTSIPASASGGFGFTFSGLLGSGPNTRSMAAGDFNGDGTLDVVQGFAGTAARVFVNDGRGNFTLGATLGGASASGGVAVGDFNGDGNLDIALTNSGAASQVFLNNGLGNFTIINSVGSAASARSVGVGDFNRDGKLDLVLGYAGQPARVFLNNGSAVFSAGTTLGSLSPSASTTTIAVGDVNGDNAPDIVLGNFNQNSRVFLNNNDGTGAFSTGSVLPQGGTNSSDVAVGDLNGDGALDIVIDTLVYLNNGSGAFPGSTSIGNGASAFSVAVGDLNGDGALDIVVGNGFTHPAQVYLNTGGGFTPSANLGSGAFTRSLVVADFNGDAALDVVLGNSGQPNQLFLNNGTIGFSQAAVLGSAANTYVAGVGDLNGDGALDIVLATTGATSPIYLNDGAGHFPTVRALTTGTITSTTSVALADLDGNGTLDLVSGNSGQPSRVYLNNGAGSFTPDNSIGGGANTQAVVTGDLNGDGALDVVLANNGQPSRVYRNNGAGSFTLSAALGGAANTTSVAIGDLNGDGALDMVLGNYQQPSQVYLNNGLGGFSPGGAIGPGLTTYSVALGDLNGDGALDVVLGNYLEPVQVYLNDGAGHFTAGATLGSGSYTHGVAVGDLNGDGALDVVLSNGFVQPSQVYLNDRSGQFHFATTLGNGESAYDVELGDLNGDGTLDVVLGNYQAASLVYVNRIARGAQLANNPAQVSVARPTTTRNANFFSTPIVLGKPTIPITYTVYDPEGDAVRFVRAFFSMDGGDHWRPAVAAGATVTTNLATGTALQFDGVDDRVVVPSASAYNTSVGTWSLWFKTSQTPTVFAAAMMSRHDSVGSFNGLMIGVRLDGKVFVTRKGNGTLLSDIVGTRVITDSQWHHLAFVFTQASGGMTSLYVDGTLETTSPNDVAWSFNNQDLSIGASPDGFWDKFDGQIDDVRIYNRALSAAEIQATMRQSLAGNDPPGGLVGYWPFDEGAGTSANDATANHNNGALGGGVAASRPVWSGGAPIGKAYPFTWDTFASGFFGQSDNVVFRLEVYPSLKPTVNGVPIFQRPYAASTTFPFRVRGTQVRVLSSTMPISNAIVYRLPVGESAALPFADGAGRPFRTDALGYLQGRGQLNFGDKLVALLPISSTDSYTLYFTSAAPTIIGLNAYTVTTSGVQTLTVGSTRPLILFNLDVSLEWDARKDSAFMQQLQFDLKRASELLYDWTNGQAALGQIRIYHDHVKWNDAHIRVYATNRLRPNAAQGGIVMSVMTDPVTSTVIYDPGQVRIGAVWNRYGEPSGNLSDDWPRTLAHELGHFALYLDDDYLGVNANGVLIPIDTCANTAMSDPYRDDYSEFHYSSNWLPGCANTLANRSTGRADWTTIKTFYPWLNDTATNSGPTGLPLAVTQISVIIPVTPTTVLDVPIFYLTHGGAHYAPGADAHAFLLQADRLIDEGRPLQDQVTARGARPGDRLCVFEAAAQRLGCGIVTPGVEQLAMVDKPGWQPDILVTPITSRTINISVTNVAAGLALQARLYPVNDPASATVTLATAGSQYYGTFNLSEAAPEGNVQVWVNEGGVRREIITDYAVGGDPGFLRGRGGFLRGRGGFLRGRGAPAMSSDGQVIMFGEGLTFQNGEYYTLQGVPNPPALPAWTTLVGQAYRLTASANAPSLSKTSINFNYLGSEVPPGDEAWLRIYFFNGAKWQQLPTQLDTYSNNASAATQGVGLYALMSSIEIPLYGPGWDLFAYPVPATRTVTEGLQSIAGYYSMVYWYNGADKVDPWKLYAPLPVTYPIDLHELRFGEAYWISLTRAITLNLRGAAAPDQSLNLPSPPATFYGTVLTSANFTPMAGMTVTAWINGQLCGQGQTMNFNSQIVYSINVNADGPGGSSSCGAAGRFVVFQIGSEWMMPRPEWNNDRIWEMALVPAYRTYLPLIRKG